MIELYPPAHRVFCPRRGYTTPNDMAEKYYDPATKRVTYIAGYINGSIGTLLKCLKECKAEPGLTIPRNSEIRFCEYGPPVYQYMVGFEFVSETPPTGDGWYFFPPRSDYVEKR